MQVLMLDWKRKRVPHCTACWDCYRSHRGCDGARPCGRCVALGRAMSCRDPDPDERLPRKRKKSNPSYDEGKEPPSGKISERKSFYVVDPHVPPAPSNPPRSYPNNDTIRLCSPPASACTYSAIDSLSSARCYGTNEQAPLLAGLVHQVQQLYQATRSLQESQTIVREQIVALDTTHQTLHTPITHIQQSNLDRPTCTTTCITPHQPQQLRQTQITKKYELPLSTQELMEEMLEEISNDNPTNALALKSQPVRAARSQFGESMFMPFVLQDSTKVPSLS